MYGCESWTIKKAEHRKIDAFFLLIYLLLKDNCFTEFCCFLSNLNMNSDVGEDSWESLELQEINPKRILKEISPKCSLEGLVLKLKCQNFGHLMWRTDSLEKTLMLGKIEGKRRRGQQRMRWGGRWEGVSKGRGYMYTYGWFMLRFDRKQQNSVKQLSFNRKIN